MAEALYQSSSERQRQYAQHEWPALTPYSAVSSFNLPAHYDASLMTPVQNMVSPAMPTKMRPVSIKHEPLSPATLSPSYHFWTMNDAYSSSRPKSPMKHKVRGDNGPSNQPRLSAVEVEFPPSPFFCEAPYYGSFTVSAGYTSSPQPDSATTTSSIMAPDSNWQELGTFTELPDPVPIASSYGRSQAPLLIAPDPSSRKSSSRTYFEPQRQDSPASDYSTLQTSLPSQATPDASPQSRQSSATMMSRRKSNTSYDGVDNKSGEEESNKGNNNPMFLETQFIIQARLYDKLPWKEVTDKFNRKFKKNMHTPALEMRLKRHKDRSRAWSDADKERALILAHESYTRDKWGRISDDMLKHDVEEKWAKESVKRKWEDMHPEGTPEYLDPVGRKRRSCEKDSSTLFEMRNNPRDVESGASPGCKYRFTNNASSIIYSNHS